MEEWRDVINYVGYYQVSNIGRVRSSDRYIKGKNGSMTFKKGRIRKLQPMKSGYLSVLLIVDGIYKLCYVHRLVAEAFIPNPDNLPEVNHKDHNVLNCNVENLEWCTHAHNMRDRRPYKIGVTLQYDLNGNLLNSFSSVKEAANVLFPNIKRASDYISAVRNGRKKTYKGYIFKKNHPLVKKVGKSIWESGNYTTDSCLECTRYRPVFAEGC